MDYHWDWPLFFRETGFEPGQIYLDWFVDGLGWTLAIALTGWVLALALGTLLGVLRTLPGRGGPALARAYVGLFRNVPLLVQLFIWYFLIPDWLPEPVEHWYKLELSPALSAWVSVVLCLGLFTAARVAEQVRTGLEALPGGQRQAALALGLTLGQAYRKVLLPQALRIILPPLTSEFLNIVKNSSVASLIGLMELLAQTRQTAEFTARLFEPFILATLIYLVLNLGLMGLMRQVEKRLAVPGLTGQNGGH